MGTRGYAVVARESVADESMEEVQLEVSHCLDHSRATEWQDKYRRSVLRNFVHMSVCFSLNHACVTAALALSTANLGSLLGNVANAT